MLCCRYKAHRVTVSWSLVSGYRACLVSISNRLEVTLVVCARYLFVSASVFDALCAIFETARRSFV